MKDVKPPMPSRKVISGDGGDGDDGEEEDNVDGDGEEDGDNAMQDLLPRVDIRWEKKIVNNKVHL